MTTLANPRSTLQRWRLGFLAVEIMLLIALLLLTWLSTPQAELRSFVMSSYVVLGFGFLFAWSFILLIHRSQLTSLWAALIPCWLPFAFVFIWMIFTLSAD